MTKYWVITDWSTCVLYRCTILVVHNVALYTVSMKWSGADRFLCPNIELTLFQRNGQVHIDSYVQKLDLRYDPWGAVSPAIYLKHLIKLFSQPDTSGCLPTFSGECMIHRLLCMFVISSDRDGAQYDVVSLAACLGLWHLHCASQLQIHNWQIQIPTDQPYYLPASQSIKREIYFEHMYCYDQESNLQSNLGSCKIPKHLNKFNGVAYSVPSNQTQSLWIQDLID